MRATKEEYFIGQLVELVVDHPDDNEDLMAGDTGIIKSVRYGSRYIVSVDFEKPFLGAWDCDCGCKYGWLLQKEEFRIIAADEDDFEINFDESFLAEYMDAIFAE